MRCLSLLATTLLAVAATCQTEVIVLTEHPAGAPRAQLLRVDLGSGAVLPVGRFAADGEVPLALAVDAADRHLVVALLTAAGTTRLVRLGLRGATVVFERDLGRVPASAAGVQVETAELAVATGGATGALLAAPRNGGAPRLVAATAWATATESLPPSNVTWVATSPPFVDPILALFDLATGQALFGPVPLAGLAGRQITGVFDLPTGAIRQVVSDATGQLHLFEFLSQVRPLPLVPPLPAGATTAMHPLAPGSFDALLLGDARSPNLIVVPVFGSGGGQWRQLAGPLPGSPVDFVVMPRPAAAAIPFGESCGGPQWTISALPRLGTTPSFGVRGAPPAVPAAAVFGVSDQRAGAVPLPWPTPLGCAVLVSPDAVLPLTTDAGGNADLRVAIGAQSALDGTIVFAQWLILQPGVLTGSAGAALHLAR